MRTYHKGAERHEPLLRTVSLGAGVQSSALLLLACEGQLGDVDAAIFADTGWEPQAVYDHLERLEVIAADAGLPVHRVSAGNIREDAMDPEHRFASMPLFTTGEDGSRGMARRQCTQEYKVRPIRDRIRELVADRLGIDAPTWRQVPNDVRVEQLFGISLDEAQRMRTPRDRWSINYYPLVELGMRRGDCRRYLEGRGLDAPRSACIGCPYHSDREWRRLRDEAPDEWQDAVEFDAAMREGAGRSGAGQLNGTAYLHRQRVPLEDVDLTTREDAGQLTLMDGFDAECEGMCGL